MTRQVSLLANDQSVEIDYFVQGFIDHTIGGILAGLEGTEEIKSMDVSIEGEKVVINLNNALVPINPFVSVLIRNTIVGMVSSLKGVSKARAVEVLLAWWEDLCLGLQSSECPAVEDARSVTLKL